jgi:hypothetical protein
MQTVIRTPTFLSDAKAAGLSDDEQNDIVAEISKNPTAGALMEGTGGCRKLRFAGKGKGKRGGFRTVHYYAGGDVPVLLLALIDKGEDENLSKLSVTNCVSNWPATPMTIAKALSRRSPH